MAKLKLQLPSMTKVLKMVGEFVRDNPEQVVYCTINEVADEAGTSVASVMRFCKELDYTSFASFKLALAHELAVQVKDDKSSSGPQDEKTYAAQLSEQLCEVIQMTARLVRASDIEEVAQAIINAKRVFLFGVGASYIPASFMNYKLTRLGIASSLSADDHMTAMAVNASGADDLLLLFSSSGSIRDSISLAELARQKSIPAIAITSRVKSPLGQVCDRQLVAMGSESPLSSGSLVAKCGQLVIVEMLFDAVCRMSEPHALRIEGAADAVADKQY
ncbi:MAG: MurR/RpiR family transcriptional regulator [Pseudomonadales bacterium]